MARLLHRLGRAAASRPLAVLLAWLLLAAGVAGAMAALQEPLTDEFELPDSEFAQVLDHLGEQVPAVAGGTGTVVLHSDAGFTATQRATVRATLADWGRLPHVSEAADPFAIQEELDSRAAALRQGEQRLERGWEQHDEGRLQLRRLRWLVAEGQRDLARVEAEDPADPTLPARREGQAQLEQRLADGREQLAEAEQRLEQGRAEFETARDLSMLGDGVRLVSEDGRTALVQLRFDASVQEVPPEALERIPETGEQLAAAGVEVDYGQEVVQETEVGGVGEVIGLAVAAVVLLVMLGSLVMAGLPLVVAFLGVGVSMMTALALTSLLEIQQMAPVLGTMLGLAVGIDYALFIVNRHRTQLTESMAGQDDPPTREEVRDSIALATGTAGTAVVVAGATVVIALAALAVSGIPTLVQMGLLAAATVVGTVLVALTVTPALLALVGARAVPRRRRRRGATAPGAGWPDRWVRLVTRRPTAVVLVVVTLLGVVALPASVLRLGLPDGGSEPPGSTALQAYERVERAFGAGSNGPVLVSADVDRPIPEDRLRERQLAVAEAVAAVPGARNVLPVGVSEDRRTLAFQVVPTHGPSAQQTVDLVDALRGPVTEDLAGTGVDLGVTGQTVANIEVSERLADALPLYLALVIGLSLLLLTVVFRSVVVPLLATAGFLLSVGASFGAIVAVYQWGWLGPLLDVHRPGAVFSFMPTLLVGILFGLAMDYQMFLVSGMRESYVHGQGAREAVRSGFVSGAKVVAAAGAIMVSVFSGFIFSEMTMARPIGFGLAIGVLIDAFVVRMTLTPAAMWLLGDKAWWMPVWLDRVLPHVDVEGSSLVEERRGPRRAAAEDGAADRTDQLV